MDLGISSAAGDGYAFTIRRQGGILFRPSLLGAVSVIVVAQHLTDLFHQFQFRVGLKFTLLFVSILFHIEYINMENAK
jgi:hypothetical protein